MKKIDNIEISVAPMMDWTDRHCRYFHRLIAPSVKLYTEMVTTGALLHGDRDRFLTFNEAEHPVALQLGGSDPAALAACAKMGEDYGYDEINLNCGCPSDRVQSGRFGACLMKEPDLVAECVAAMKNAVKIPVTVKSRIGIDHDESFEFLDTFISKIASAGCETFILHARKAWLSGLSPKENREKPPLNYARAAEIKSKYPHLKIILNGGITNIETIKQTLSSPIASLDGVMIGREAYQNPWFLNEIENQFFTPPPYPPPIGGRKETRSVSGGGEKTTRESVAIKMSEYARLQHKKYGTPVKSITRHILGLYHGQKNGKIWRRALSTLPHEPGADEGVILKALEKMKP
jgi:tRNA-dihydrouridine synthase A